MCVCVMCNLWNLLQLPMKFFLTVFDLFCWRVSPSSPSGRLARRWALRWITTLGLRRWGWQGWFVPGNWRKAGENGLKHGKSHKRYSCQNRMLIFVQRTAVIIRRAYYSIIIVFISKYRKYDMPHHRHHHNLLLEAIKVDEAIYRAAHERFSELLQRPGTLNSLIKHWPLDHLWMKWNPLSSIIDVDDSDKLGFFFLVLVCVPYIKCWLSTCHPTWQQGHMSALTFLSARRWYRVAIACVLVRKWLPERPLKEDWKNRQL